MRHSLLLSLWIVSAVFALDNGLGKTPPMGWNSWNAYACDVSETKIKKAADAIIRLNLDKLGYNYVNVDDCWAKGRFENGSVYQDNQTFPSGMKSLADYVHSKGLKFGIYSDAGTETCAGRPGSLGYETQDANTYAEWGVDFLKYDNCHNNKIPPKTRYPPMTQALNATGRPIFFAMCEWGVDYPWLWAAEYANSWRVFQDIKNIWPEIRIIIDEMAEISHRSAPYGWNDPDMLEVGNKGMTHQQYVTHFVFWCFWKSPLIIGTDLDKISDEDLWILTRSELIAVNQDPLGLPALRKKVDLLGSVWASKVQNGTAVLMFNGVDYEREMTLKFEEVEVKGSVKLRDILNEKDLGTFTDSYKTKVVGDGVVALLIQEDAGYIESEEELERLFLKE